MSKNIANVFVYPNYRAAESSIRTLRKSGYDIQKLSVIGLDQPEASPDDADRIEKWRQLAELRSFWCRMWRLIAGDAFLRVEGIGPVLAVGPVAESIITTWADSHSPTGYNPLLASLLRFGISRGSTIKYQEALQAGCYLLIAPAESKSGMMPEEILKRQRGSALEANNS